MPIEFPKPKYLRGAGYAPIQEYIPKLPLPAVSDVEVQPTPEYECKIKIHASKSVLDALQVGVFSLLKTSEEDKIQRWQMSEETTPYRHTVLTTECFQDEEKTLLHEFFSDIGVSESFKVEPKPIDSNHINAEFVPFLPSVETNECLGWATHGFYYYFVDGRLVYEFDILGNGKWAWCITHSTQDGISSERVSDQVFTSLLVPVSIEGQPIPPQYILYRRTKLTNDELAEINTSWLDEHATLIDTKALTSICEQKLLPRETKQDKANVTQPEANKHTVKNKEDGQPEQWTDIAALYGIGAKDLLSLNPAYEHDPLSLSVGDVLFIEDALDSVEDVEQAEQPSPITKPSVGKCYPFGDAWGHYLESSLSASVKRIFNHSDYSSNIAVLDVAKVEEKVLRIGVFFDGTGQNHLNDKYKESHGVKSRTNVARLFEVYPVNEEDVNKIYVSGVGTVDDAWKNPTLIDEGKDEVDLAQAFGVSPNKLHQTSTFIDAAYNLVADETGAFYKWQNWTRQFYGVITDLIRKQTYGAITHIEFDVFGFSRGAALARHFVNAIKDGLPDYDKPRDGEKFGEVYPNLLAHQDDISSQPKHGYYPDETRTCSVRFVGLFDTVGSFYLAGNNNEGNFELGLDTNCAERVFQISAHHEYRKNFPLTSLLPSDGILPSNFYEEAFAGCHTDIGGGYPSKEQYAKQGLPERYGMPLSATYNRELMKTESIRQEVQTQQNAYGAAACSERLHKQAQDVWDLECSSKGLYGVVTLVNGILYYYELQPISNALSALSLERMKQQAENIGVQWAREVEHPSDFIQLTGSDSALTVLNEKLLTQPLGSITPTHWQGEISQYGKEWIHRPHDALINAGCATPMDNLVNAVTKEGNQLKRVVFDNEV
ncbi:TPA: DUF2235 domain-containing protein [Vibrio parahaemolyticus]|uniref:DUF2235 domain-containing protein n=1 Tax=Vibrio harveyi group TaxID=717610 RepID=UPI001B835F2E|nr:MULTISPECIES: DUF2235 domain-containing protein [Vibrio harveyi group]MCX4135847.1 DUF2235 domain-containing protein [Vibrio parahaemolyticus]MCZ6386457.1 DUF2235 domain-containing protein [Vibrio parahaemolyticus]MDA0385927.1 DUF2235 domain-containing protein [Vibrio owensii]HBC0002005.1 DUF2235 domain-containing protein [Vibrio parahaemolyticus]HBC3388061.1 DUF2235 domain-containing protein [Vibrio parahaemolyticus]